MTRVRDDDRSVPITALGDQIEALMKASGLPVRGFVIFLDHPDDPTLLKSESRSSLPDHEMKSALIQLVEDF